MLLCPLPSVRSRGRAVGEAMELTSRPFRLEWLAGAALTLALAAGSSALEPGPSPAEEADAGLPSVGAAPPSVGAPPPASAAITVIGTVQVRPADAREGRLVQIVDEEGERTLIVDEVGAGRALSKHAGEQVSATGVLARRKDGREVLLLSSFRPLGG